jgi:hypothetical protein
MAGDSALDLERRILHALVVTMVAALAYFLVSMFDRFDARIAEVGYSVEQLEDENKERDAKLAELVLNIERRLSTLEAR